MVDLIVAIHLHQTGDVVPHSAVRRVKYMCPIGVNVYAHHLVAVYVTSSVRSAVYDQTAFACKVCLMGEYRAIETGTNYNVVVHVLRGLCSV